MGIHDLLNNLKSIVDIVNISAYKGKTVAVDGYTWIHRGVYACSQQLAQGEQSDAWISYCEKRLALLHRAGVKPYFVFDGANLPAKAATEAQRKVDRQLALQLARDALASGDSAAARKAFSRAVDVTPQLVHRWLLRLRAAAIPFVVAPYEADAQLAFLYQQSIVYAVLTEDSDMIPFGVGRVLFKMDDNGNGEQIERSNLARCEGLDFTHWTDDMVLNFCILCGCDYLPNPRNMGPKKAHAFVAAHSKSGLPALLSVLQFEAKPVLPAGYGDAFRRARMTFLHQRVFDPVSRKLTTVTPLPAVLLNSAVSALDFLGPLIPDELAAAIADGRVDPTTRLAYPAEIAASSSLSFSSITTLIPATGGYSRAGAASSSTSTGAGMSISHRFGSVNVGKLTGTALAGGKQGTLADWFPAGGRTARGGGGSRQTSPASQARARAGGGASATGSPPPDLAHSGRAAPAAEATDKENDAPISSRFFPKVRVPIPAPPGFGLRHAQAQSHGHISAGRARSPSLARAKGSPLKSTSPSKASSRVGSPALVQPRPVDVFVDRGLLGQVLMLGERGSGEAAEDPDTVEGGEELRIALAVDSFASYEYEGGSRGATHGTEVGTGAVSAGAAAVGRRNMARKGKGKLPASTGAGSVLALNGNRKRGAGFSSSIVGSGLSALGLRNRSPAVPVEYDSEDGQGAGAEGSRSALSLDQFAYTSEHRPGLMAGAVRLDLDSLGMNGRGAGAGGAARTPAVSHLPLSLGIPGTIGAAVRRSAGLVEESGSSLSGGTVGGRTHMQRESVLHTRKRGARGSPAGTSPVITRSAAKRARGLSDDTPSVSASPSLSPPSAYMATVRNLRWNGASVEGRGSRASHLYNYSDLSIDACASPLSAPAPPLSMSTAPERNTFSLAAHPHMERHAPELTAFGLKALERAHTDQDMGGLGSFAYGGGGHGRATAVYAYGHSQVQQGGEDISNHAGFDSTGQLHVSRVVGAGLARTAEGTLRFGPQLRG